MPPNRAFTWSSGPSSKRDEAGCPAVWIEGSLAFLELGVWVFLWPVLGAGTGARVGAGSVVGCGASQTQEDLC